MAAATAAMLGRALLGAMLAVALGAGVAEARTNVFLGFGLGFPGPFYYPPPYYAYPPPYYAYPPPVTYAPPPMIYNAPPSAYQQPAQSWYYCDNPRGYYPYVTSCSSGWRQVPATP